MNLSCREVEQVLAVVGEGMNIINVLYVNMNFSNSY